jgi:putative addiction module component (TIGR02574 family)
MSRAFSEIERDIRALSDDERARLLKTLINDLDGPADADSDQAWLEESERRLEELDVGVADAVSGASVLKDARARLK